MAQQPLEKTSWITKTEGVCQGEARVRNTRHTVAGIVQWRNLGLTNDQILQHHPDLTERDLDAAFQYYRTNQAEIDRAIQLDEDA
jgi:uncharacterized protein (DUF433 family)